MNNANRQQTIRDNFEQFNPYAREALEDPENADVLAMLAFAFELSQLRYQLTKRLDAQAQKRQSSH